MKNLFLPGLIALSLGTMTVFAQTTIPLTPKTSLVIIQGDITTLHVDAIVNAANEQLRGGAGVCGAIFKAAGWDELQRACNAYPIQYDDVRCSVGSVRVTRSFALNTYGIKHIIHAVGPDCRKIHNPAHQDQLLKYAYTNSLFEAHEIQATSIAFPFISSGIYGFPKERAAKIALESIKKYVRTVLIRTTQLKTVYIVLASESDYNLFVALATE